MVRFKLGGGVCETRLYRLWTTELDRFRGFLASKQWQLDHNLSLKCDEVKPWSHVEAEILRQETLRQERTRSLSRTWLITPHDRPELFIGDILAVLHLSLEAQQQTRMIVDRVDGWQQWFGARFTIARSLQEE